MFYHPVIDETLNEINSLGYSNSDGDVRDCLQRPNRSEPGNHSNKGNQTRNEETRTPNNSVSGNTGTTRRPVAPNGNASLFKNTKQGCYNLRKQLRKQPGEWDGTNWRRMFDARFDRTPLTSTIKTGRQQPNYRLWNLLGQTNRNCVNKKDKGRGIASWKTRLGSTLAH